MSEQCIQDCKILNKVLARSVDDYAEEFYQLLTRNEINNSQVQLVSHFIGGLKVKM